MCGCYAILGISRCSADGTGLGGDLGPEISALLGAGASDVLALHLTLGVHNNAGIVLKVQEETFTATNGFTLTDDNSGHDLFTELGLTLSDGAKEHVTDGTGGEAVKAGTEAGNCDHVQGFGTSVVSAVHH